MTDELRYSQHFTPAPVERGRPGKASTGVPTDPPQAVLDVRQVVEDLKVITAGLWATIAAYEHQLADGYPTSTPGGDHPREHGEPRQYSACRAQVVREGPGTAFPAPQTGGPHPDPRETVERHTEPCGNLRPCPDHDVSGTSTERAALNRDARKLFELNRRCAHLRVSASDTRSYLESIQRRLGAANRTDTEKRSSLCETPGCDLDYLTDLHGRPITVYCADGIERRLCDTHQREATRCALCHRKAEQQPTGKIKLHSVIVNGVHQQMQLCKAHLVEARQAS